MTDVDLGFMTFECLFDSPIQISAMMLADRRSYWFRFPLLACPGFAQVVHVPSKALDARKLPRLPAFCNCMSLLACARFKVWTIGWIGLVEHLESRRLCIVPIERGAGQYIDVKPTLGLL